MKKILSVLLVLIMVVALVACNSSKQDETTKEDVTTETTTQKETEQTTTVETTTDETTEETTEQTTEETTTDKTEPEKKSIKIFAIGNSFSEDSVEHLYGILKDLGYEEIVIGNMYTGGCSLAQHAKNIEHREKGFYTTYYENTNGKWVSNPVQPTLVNTINRHDWDYISIQQVSGDSGRPETFEPYLTTVLNYIKEHCPDAEIMWNMTWAYPSDKTYSSFKNYDNDQMKMYNAILEATKTMIVPREDFSFVIPVGTAVQNARTSFLTERQLHRDELHLSNYIGRYLAAMMWARQITGMSVKDVTFNPQVSQITPEIMEVIKESVENAYNHPFEITKSEFTEIGSVSTDDVLRSYNVDPSKYKKLDYTLTTFSYWNSNTSTELVCEANGSTATNLNQYASTQLFDKTQIPVGSIIIVVNGYQYRPDAFVEQDGVLLKNGTGTGKSGYTRQEITAKEAVAVTEEWWADWSVVGFNISMVGNPALKESVMKSFSKKFTIYVPIDPNEPIPNLEKEINNANLEEVLKENGFDISDYDLLDLKMTTYAYYNSTSNSALVSKIGGSTASNINQFAATKIFKKDELPNGSLVVVFDGYQYRPEGWTSLSSKTSNRPTNVVTNGSNLVTVVDDNWWASWNYRAFNVAKAGNPGLSDAEMQELLSVFYVLVPKGSSHGEENKMSEELAKLLSDNGYNPDNYKVPEVSFTKYAYYNSTANSTIVSKEGGSTATNLNQFAATQIFTKAELPNGTLIIVLQGFQYRPEGWTDLSTKNSSSSRPANVTAPSGVSIVEVDATWWGSWNYRAFNVAKVGNPALSDAEMDALPEVFFIVVPK